MFRTNWTSARVWHRVCFSEFAKAIFVKFGPEDLSVPCSRPRTFLAGINSENWFWLGPDVENGDCTDHFLSFVQRKASLDASAFSGIDCAKNFNKMMQTMASRRDIAGPDDDPKNRWHLHNQRFNGV